MLQKDFCNTVVILTALALFAGVVKPAHGETPPSSSTGSTMRGLPGVVIEPSRLMRAKGYPWAHEIRIALPRSYGEKDRRFPVLWVMDGNYWFETAVRIANTYGFKYLPQMIVVGVGVPPDAESEYQMRRTFDFNPNNVVGFEGYGGDLVKPPPGVPVFKGGGAAAFLTFLVDDVRKALARDYQTSGEGVLFGDSGGGTFCTYALLERPAAFQKYICGSPALYMGNFGLFKLEEAYHRAHSDLAAEVFFGAGEGEVTEKGTAAAGIVSSMTRMAEILTERSYPSLQLHVRISPGQEHLSAIPDNLYWGLRSVMRKPPE